LAQAVNLLLERPSPQAGARTRLLRLRPNPGPPTIQFRLTFASVVTVSHGHANRA